ncbi:MAG: PepSY-associated TM helix domain-containing protein [Myxococcota bacterium]
MRKEAKKARRRWWFWLHSWLGLKLSILLGFVLATGTLAVLSHEVDWLLEPAMRADGIEPEAIAWGAAFDAARRERPEAAWLSLTRPVGDGFALQATLITSWGEPVRLWLDPRDGSFQGETRWFNVQRFFRMVHRHLMLPPKVGIPIVSALSLPLLLSLVSGLVIYGKFWRGFFRRPRFERRPRLWLGDLHRLAGVWSAWFVALMSITGMWYLVESLGGDAPVVLTVEVPARDERLPADFDGARLDAAVESARAQLPGLAVESIVFPEEADRALVVGGQLTASLVRSRSNAVHFDPITGAVLGSRRGEELGVHQRLSEAADPLHFGTFGGLTTKFLWFVAGLFLTGLAISGALVYVERIRQGLERGQLGRRGSAESETRPEVSA